MNIRISQQLQIAMAMLFCAVNVHAQDEYPEPPLGDIWMAVSEGIIEAVRKHIKAGTDLNASPGNQSGEWDDRTPLWIAVTEGHKAIVKLLLENGANPNKFSSVGAGPDGLKIGTPLHFNVWRQSGAKTPDWTVAEWLVEHGAKVDAKSGYPYHNTLLQWAIQNSHTEAVKWLLEHGAKSANLLDAVSTWRQGFPSGDWYDNHQIVKLLLEQGANPNVKDQDGNTPLQLAQKRGLKKSVHIIVEYSEDINFPLESGKTILHLAVESGDIKRVERLLKKGASPNTMDDFLDTPLHTAVLAKQSILIRILLEAGADAGARNKKGKTPYQLALDGGNRKILYHLYKYSRPRLALMSKPKKFKIYGIPKQNCVILHSTDLDRWTEVGTVKLETNSNIYYDKKNKGPVHFYKVRLEK